jgi:hypothetical protein
MFIPLLLERTTAIFLQKQQLIQLLGKCEHQLFPLSLSLSGDHVRVVSMWDHALLLFVK